MSGLAERLPDVAALLDALDDDDYLADPPLATALFLAARMGQPILLEGEPGVGKTEAAKALAGGARHAADQAAVLRGPDLGRGPLRVELPAAAARHPAGRGPRRDAARGGPVQRGLPARPAAARRDRASGAAPGRAADRRGRPGRRRVRGVPVRAAGRVRGDHPRARHAARGVPAGRGADLEPDPRPARRAQAPVPVPLDRLPGHGPGGRDHPAPGAGRGGSRSSSRSRTAWPGCAGSTWPSRPASPRRSAGPRRCTCSARRSSTRTRPSGPRAPCSSTPRTWRWPGPNGFGALVTGDG